MRSLGSQIRFSTGGSLEYGRLGKDQEPLDFRDRIHSNLVH